MDMKDINEMQDDLDLHVELYDFLKSCLDCDRPFSNFTIFNNGGTYQFVDLDNDSGYVVRDISHRGLGSVNGDLSDIELRLQNQDYITTPTSYFESYSLTGLEFWKDSEDRGDL